MIKLKSNALRSGVWFKALPRIDRALIDLTIKVADNIKSAVLAKSIIEITKKIKSVNNKIEQAVKQAGLPIAKKVSELAQTWGNCSAKKWSVDFSFIKYLAVLYLNEG